MSKSRAGLAVGVALVGGAGYYLYSAGGDPKAAEKKFEHDIQSVRDRAAAGGKEAQSEAEKLGAQVGAKADAAWNKTSEEVSRAAKSAEAYAKDAQAQLNKSIDAADKKIEEASKGKSSWSSWFGGK